MFSQQFSYQQFNSIPQLRKLASQTPTTSQPVVMIFVGVALLLRFKELCELTMADLKIHDQFTEVKVRMSKTDIGAKGVTLMMGCVCQNGPVLQWCPHHRLKAFGKKTKTDILFPEGIEVLRKRVNTVMSGAANVPTTSHSLRRTGACLLSQVPNHYQG
jgi:hypothetical protein